jgi:hypothetical protein
MVQMQFVARREVRSAARRPVTFWSRTAAGAAGLFVLATFGTNDSREMFMRGVATGFLLCLLEGVRLASPSIVDERNEGTLGLLLLTKLGGDELLLGKLTALGFSSLQTLMAIVPVLCVSLVFGGVSAGEILRAALGLTYGLFLSLTIGLIVSTYSRTTAGAIIKTFIVLLLSVFFFSLDWSGRGLASVIIASINPMTPIWAIDDLQYAPVKTEYWVALSWTILMALFALRAVGRDLTRFYALQEARIKQPAERDEWAEQYAGEVIGRERAQWFSGNPIEWLALRNMRSNSVLRRRVTVVGAVLLTFALLAIGEQATQLLILIGLVFGFIYSVSSAMTFARARQSNEIEMWLTTPLTLQEIVAGNIAAIRKTFMWPGLIMVCGWGAIYYSVVIRRVVEGTTRIGIYVPGVGEFTSIYAAVYLLICALLAMSSLLFALPYVAMWIALRSKRPSQAAVRTFVTMVIAPWFILLVPKFLLFIPLGKIARKKVEEALRDFAFIERRETASVSRI